MTQPRAIIDPIAHRLAEFAVVGNVDAQVLLFTHDVGNRLLQQGLKCPLVGRGVLFALAIDLYQIVGSR